MKSWLFKGVLAATIAWPALSGAARAGSADDYGCSNATLKGEYAFGVTGYLPSPQVVAGIKIFDGNGKLKQMDYIGDSSPASFRTGETGTYNVNPDCTGSMVIDLNVGGIPRNGVIELVFVIANGGGRAIHAVVSQFTPPFASSPVNTQTRSDFWKVGSEQDN